MANKQHIRQQINETNGLHVKQTNVMQHNAQQVAKLSAMMTYAQSTLT